MPDKPVALICFFHIICNAAPSLSLWHTWATMASLPPQSPYPVEQGDVVEQEGVHKSHGPQGLTQTGTIQFQESGDQEKKRKRNCN